MTITYKIFNTVYLLSLLTLFSLVSFRKLEGKIHSSAKDFKPRGVLPSPRHWQMHPASYATCKTLPSPSLKAPHATGQGSLSTKQICNRFASSPDSCPLLWQCLLALLFRKQSWFEDFRLKTIPVTHFYKEKGKNQGVVMSTIIKGSAIRLTHWAETPSKMSWEPSSSR